MHVSVGFSIHRPEVLALTEPVMREHQCICMEEPRTPGFNAMLRGEMDIAEYLMAVDFEFPVFARMTCELLQVLNAEGRVVLQVDPYMEALLEVHELFASGGAPEDVPQGTLAAVVYQCEKAWYGALLGFYTRSMGKDFMAQVEAVKTFGRADAARGRLRDDLRAQEIARIAGCGEHQSIYVEAGYIHTYLLTALRRRLPHGVEVRPKYLMESVVRELEGKRQALGPGDVLTLTYTYKPDYQGEAADLQAARSLVRIKILHKEEMDADPAGFPHTRDEVAASRLVRALNFEQCREVYAQIQRADTRTARRMVEEYVAGL